MLIFKLSLFLKELWYQSHHSDSPESSHSSLLTSVAMRLDSKLSSLPVT